MANYVATARSSYFKVKDADAFADFCERWNLNMISRDDTNLHGFLCTDQDHGLPSEPDDYQPDENGEYTWPSLIDELATHLAPGWVAVVMEAGAENYRYIGGYAVAVNAAGKHKDLALADIYTQAEQLGAYTHAEN